MSQQLVLMCVQGDKNASKSSMRVLVNVGKAEVELLKAPQEGSSDLNHLARFMIGGLWVSFRTTYGGACLSPICLARCMPHGCPLQSLKRIHPQGCHFDCCIFFVSLDCAAVGPDILCNFMECAIHTGSAAPAHATSLCHASRCDLKS